jgi:O-antigen/teichoic acid export membrane protein
MVVANIQNLAASFISGMEALFGDMLARKEQEKLNRTFSVYETIISVVAVILFAVTTVMVVPFVRIYTAGVTDTDYEAPLFAVLLILSALLYCLRMPYHSAIIAAGHFRQTQAAAYGEALLNVGLSILLVMHFGLVGVAIGTLTATAFRLVYYVGYLSRRILNRPVRLFLRRSALNAVLWLASVWAGWQATSLIEMTNYALWAIGGVLAGLIALAVTAAGNLLIDRRNCRALLSRGKAVR